MQEEQKEYETMGKMVSKEIIGGAPTRALSPRRLGKQHGRTLLEMLGVLAIIGVLSITALVGFTYAMNKHRANETIYDVMLRGTNVPMVDENYASKPSGYEFRFPDLPAGTYYPMTTKKDGGSSYYVEATGVTYRVCELILKMNPTDIDQIVVNNSVYTGDSDICGTSDGLAMKFCFGEDGTICDGTGHGGSSGGSSGGSGETSGGSGSGSGSGSSGSGTDPDACEGIDCGEHGTCNNGVCDCTDGYEGVHCEMPPACTTDEDCTDGEVCTDYECVCPTLDTPTECQEITSVEDGCDQLTNLPDGTVCSTGVCLEGFCCNPNDSQACCEAAGQTWQEETQTCSASCDETPCVYRYTNPIGALTANCQVTGYVNPTTIFEPMPDLNVSSCPPGQFCRVHWTNDSCTDSLEPAGASTMYGYCEQKSASVLSINSCKPSVHLTSYLWEETGCPAGKYCNLTSSDEDYANSLEPTGAGLMYGYCLSMTDSRRTCSD